MRSAQALTCGCHDRAVSDSDPLGELSEAIAPLLQRNGFEMDSTGSWKRGEGTWTAFAMHRFPPSRLGDQFTFRLFVFSDRAQPERQDAPSRPALEDALISRYIWEVVPAAPGYRDPRDDFSWNASPDDLEDVAEAVASALKEYALPFLGRFDNDDAVLDYVEELLDEGEFTVSLAAVLAMAQPLGRTEIVERAKEVAVEYACSGKHPKDLAETLDWLVANGLTLESVHTPGSMDWVSLGYRGNHVLVRLERDRGSWFATISGRANREQTLKIGRRSRAVRQAVQDLL